MKWIKYQIVCGKNENGEDILLDKKIGYSDENLAIAQTEAYNDYEIVEDIEFFDKEPLDIKFGGTHATNPLDARKNLGAFGFVRQLTSADDLNNLTETGVYTYLTSSIPKNCPYNNAGTVEVIGTGSSSGTKQVVTRYGAAGATAFRMQYEGNWQVWEKYTVARDLTDLGFDSMVKPSVGKSYVSMEKNGLRYKTAYMSGNGFPNAVFLIALNGDVAGASSLYIVIMGATPESPPIITRLSVIYDNTPYPCVEASQSGYLYVAWSSTKTADIRANIFKLA